MSILRATLAAFALALVSAGQAQSQNVDIIRGRVTGPDSLPIENVVVTATTISGNVNRTARTDRNGRYMISFPGGDGDYMVSFAALGFAARRFQVKRVADEEFLIADARLQKIGGVLDAVEVRADRQRPRRDDVAPDPSGTERVINATEVPANQMGDLAAMAASLPGVMPTTNEDGSNGYSVLGLGSDQNNATLNGMMFGGSSLPRDAAITSSLVTSPYDVSRGGFSGAQMNIRTRPGSNFISRTNSFNFDSPAMQWSDAASRSLGREYMNASLGGLVSGPIVFDKLFYSMSYQLGRRSSDYETLVTADPLGLKAAGVSDATRNALIGALGARALPVSRGLRDDRIGDNGMLLGSVDLTSPSATSGRALNLAFNASWGRQSPAGGSATELPSYGGDRTNWNYGVQGRHSSFFRNTVLTESSLGVSATRSHGDAYLNLPAGRVRATSAFDDGTSAVSTLVFGGNPGMNTRQSSVMLQAQNQLSWFSEDNKHRFKLASELRHENAEQFLELNTLGTFAYNSIADLQADAPASFSRSLAPRQRDISQVVGGIALGDSYRRTENLQLTYGVRLDGTRYLGSPALNLALDTLFGVRNDRLPNRLYVSPRAGFSWTYGRAPEIASFFGAQRGPRAVLRGGVGLFQNLPGTNVVSSALDNTGLPSAVQQITCVGAATPVPRWEVYAEFPDSIPTECADGSTPFSSVVPNVSVFAGDYVASRSIRSNLGWNGPVLNNRFATSVDFTWSLNRNQGGNYDLNFAGAQQFALAGEGGRPVYVPTANIVPATGAVAPQGSRITSRYARVTEMRSDLDSRSAQLSLRIAPTRFSTGFTWNAWYTLSDVQEEYRGFSSTAANPREIGRGPGGTPRHQVGYSLGYNFFDFVRVNWFGQFRSGQAFTPMVAGDINGDGYANDRAFLFDPAATTDTAIVNGMQSLLASGSASARECLAAQLGRIASRNSCRGPWTSNATMSFSFNPLKVRMPQRATLSFQLSNPLGAADLLVNGSDRLRGWGQNVTPDAQLLYVRGFDNSDPANPRFRYEVNRRFGATDPSLNPFRVPVTLTAMLRFDIGPTRERQMLTQQLDRGRRTEGQKAPEVMLRAMFGNGGIPNPLATILREQDTLQLSSTQADSIASMNRRYVIRLDGIWSPIVRDFTNLPDNYDHDEVYHRYLVARRQTVDLLKTLAPQVKDVLTADQVRRLPAFVASYLDTRYLASIRNGTAGLGGGGFSGGFVPAGAQVFMGGGGGGRVEVIRH